MAVHGVAAARRDHGEERHHPLGDPPVVVAVLGIAAGADEQAARALDHLEHRPRVAEIVAVALGALEQRIGIDVAAMQEGHVARIDPALHGLQPIAFLQPLGNEALPVRHQRELPFRQRRLPVGRPHIGPEHPAALDQGIGPQLDLAGEAAFLGLGGDLDALAGHVELPAVIGAAQAALLVAAEPQRRAAVGTELVDQAVGSAAVAERDEALGQHLHPHRRAVVFGQFVGEQDRGPVAAKQPAHGGPRTGLRDEIVLLLPEHSHPSGAAAALVTVATNSLRSPGQCLDLDQIGESCGGRCAGGRALASRKIANLVE